MTDFAKYLTYEPDTGRLVWKVSRGFTARAGTPAGNTVVRNGGRYRVVTVENRRFYAHRVIWILHNGPIPRGMTIDHMNGDGTDNRLANLRLATRAENHRNKQVSKANRTGVRGVYVHSQTGAYTAQITTDGKCRHLGCFSTLEDAAAARREAELKYHGEFAPSQYWEDRG